MPAQLKLPTFIDLVPTLPGNSNYWTTNEDPSLFVDMLRAQKPSGMWARGGGICSAGEMPLLLLLPRCRRVFAIDQGMDALACTFLKVLALATFGAAGAKELFERDIYIEAKPDLLPLHAQLPDALKPRIHFSPDPKASYVNGKYDSFANYWHNVRTEWHFADMRLLTRAAKRLDKLTLIHGDLLQLAAYGPFDILYTSNAITYGRSCPTPDPLTLKNVQTLIKPGGLLLATSTPHNEKDHHLVKKVARNGFRGSWNQALFVHQPPPAAAPPAATAGVRP